VATILVADDETPIVDLLRDLLEEGGHTVLGARDGREALALARRERPDLVISDVMMPHIDGVQLARLLQGDPLTHGVVVILMSAAPSPDLAAVGAVAFLAKPFDLESAVRTIARHVTTRWR
jgi:CheY-like chemotaxis protein